MIPLSTIKLIREWARWGEAMNLSFPALSPMFGERALKTPLFGSGHIPDDVFQVERAVCALEYLYRDCIIMRYQRHMTFIEMGDRMNRSRWTAKAKLREAENQVHSLLQNPCDVAHLNGTYAAQ